MRLSSQNRPARRKRPQIAAKRAAATSEFHMTFPVLGDGFVQVDANHGAQDGYGDGPAAMRVVPLLQDALPDSLGGIALDEVFRFVVLQAPGVAHPSLERHAGGPRLYLGVVRQSIPATLVEG